MLFPYEPERFWEQLRKVIKEEIRLIDNVNGNAFEVPGLTFKPLYRIIDVCALFNITRPTMYQWIKDGKLKPQKIRGNVYFLWADILVLVKGLK
ncbi:MAG: helix-turn-helix domain-containing protein [Bacteroidota bacterium]